MRLAPHETRSALWLKLQAHLTAQLVTLRQKNDGALSHEDTTRLRGRIFRNNTKRRTHGYT